jgi:antagonist of KipI
LTDVLRVEQPGLLTTVQDLGRPHAITSGVPPGGAMDRFACAAANLLVGNDQGGAALECTLRGPSLAAIHRCLVAVTGADLDARVNGAEAPRWASFTLEPGDVLTFGARRAGFRAYVAVAGGVVADRWLGSASTNLLVGRGGMHGRALVTGDVVAAGESHGIVEGLRLADGLAPAYSDRALAAIPGPHLSVLDAGSRRALFGATFAVSSRSNRMGYRLDGPRLHTEGEELLSYGLVAGVVQVPRGGQAILLMADHQTAGGYPMVATVATAWMPVAAQLAPGEELTLFETSIEHALEARRRQREALRSLSMA